MSESRYARLKLFQNVSMGRIEFKFTQVVTNPQERKMNLILSYSFVETSTRRLQQYLNFLVDYKKNTRGSYSSLKGRIRLKNDQGP